MQEQVNRESIAISVKASKLTAQTFQKALIAAMRKIKQKRNELPHGRQSVKKLMTHNQATNTIPIDGDRGLFDRIARKYHVDYAFHKTGPGKHLLLFKSGQADGVLYTERWRRLIL